MPYGTIKIDTITFTDGGVDKSVPVSGLVQNPTFTGNITVTGTISGNIIQGGTTVSGLTVTGTTANFVSGVFTTQISGVTITGTTVSTTTGNFTSLTGTTATITSGIIASGTAALPSLAILSDPNTGIYSPGADQLAISTGGSGRLFVDANGNVGVGSSSPDKWSDANLTQGTFKGALIGAVNVEGNRTTTSDVGRLAFWQTTNRIAYISAERAGADNSGALKFLTSNAGSEGERLRITAAGLVGIGISSPGYRLHAVAASEETNPESNAGAYWPLLNSSSTLNTCSALALGTNNDIGTAIVAQRVGANNEHLLKFQTRNSSGSLGTRMTLTGSGSLGIGTTSPQVDFVVSNGGASGLEIDAGYISGNSLIQAYNRSGAAFDTLALRAADFSFQVGGSTERARIDSSGRLLVGTSSGSDNNALLKVQGNVGGTTGTGWIDIRRGLTTPGSGGQLGLLSFSDASGNNYASIDAYVDATPGTNDYPGRLVFSTTADGASSPTERMRITQMGALNVAADGGTFGGGNATARFSSIAAASANYSNQQPVVIHNKGASGTRYMMSFGDGATYSERGFITWDGSNMALVNSSDKRLKTNVFEANSAVESIKQINVRSFDFIENGNHVDYGFIAQELHESAPEAVNVGADDANGNIDKPWTVGYASLVPRLTKALQEAITKIETLEARLTTLEAQ